MAAGQNPYTEYDWQLVQTHLIHLDGSIEELWRPGHNTGSADPLRLNAVLDKTIKRLDLDSKSTIPEYENLRKTVAGEDGLLLKVVLRYPHQENFQRNYTYTLDWIVYTEDIVSKLLPPIGAEEKPYVVDKTLTHHLMAHFRPFLDWGFSEKYDKHDPHEQALEQMTAATLSGELLDSSDSDKMVIGLRGSMQLKQFGEQPPDLDQSDSQWIPQEDQFTEKKKIESHDADKWNLYPSIEANVKGYIILNTSSRKIIDFQMVLDSAILTTPAGKPVQYIGMASLEQAD